MKNRIYKEEHKKLIDLVTWMPFGCYAEYFYAFMLLQLRNFTNSEIFQLYPAKIRKQILKDLEELEQLGENRAKGGAF